MKAILIFPKNFFNFSFNAVECQIIGNLSCYGSKSYTPVFLGNSEVIFLGETEDAALCRSVPSFLVIYGVAESEQ